MHATKPPLPAASIPPEWITLVRGIIQNEGRAVRPHPTLPEIEVKCLTTNRWMSLMLFGSGTTFTSMADRDTVLTELTCPLR